MALDVAEPGLVLPGRRAPTALLCWLGVGLLAVLCWFAAPSLPILAKFPIAWTIPLTVWVNAVSDAIVGQIEPVTRAMAWGFEQPMLLLRDALQATPWIVLILATAWIAYASGGGYGLVCLVVLCLLYVAFSGYWRQSMNTMALVGVAVPLSVAIGLLAGIAAQKSAPARRIILPVLDLMQTMPTFAYLIPLLVMFGFGPVVGLIASAIYAAPPMVRNVILGLQRVPEEMLEAAEISGTTRFERLIWVELPAAMAQIKIGLNQTIMAALSMVIIASVIGGFDDIGWEVLSTMRKARFGESLLAGLVIVLIAVVLDRVSAAYVSRTPVGAGRRLLHPLWILAGLAVLAVLLKLTGLDARPQAEWMRGFTAWIDAGLSDFVGRSGDVLTAIKNQVFYYYLLPLRIGFSQSILPYTWGFVFTAEMKFGYALFSVAVSLAAGWRFGWKTGTGLALTAYLLYFGMLGTPWPVVVASVALMAYLASGPGLAVFVLLVLGLNLVTGLWEKAMLSIYLCGAAAFLSFLIGGTLGFLASASDRFSRALRPVLDMFQTIPLFVFLIPALMFFQVGEFTALLAMIAYAFVPAARYVENGLRQVPEGLIEAAEMQGATPAQIFWQIKAPLAAPVILLGLNQTILYAFAMLVIAALVGTTGLGQQVYVALSSANVGLGLVAGLSMALLAMTADRIIQAAVSAKPETAE